MEDALSDLFDRIEVEGMLSGAFAMREAWSSGGRISSAFKLVALVAGSARVSADGPGGPDGPIDIAPGDVVLLNHRTSMIVESGRGPGVPVAPTRMLGPEPDLDARALAAADPTRDDIVIGGAIRVSPIGAELLRNALPGVVHVARRSPGSFRSAALVQRLFDEASHERPGSAFAIRQNAQLLLLEVLRAHASAAELDVGWLRLLADDRLAPALRRMHGDPGRQWGLAELATVAGMSRTAFAERFRSLAGEPPLTYLARWRMVLAQQALRDPETRVGVLASRLGYGSESAFSAAFKRAVGEAPVHYRRRAAAGVR